MATAKSRRSTPLDHLPLQDKDTGELTVVIETPKGSRAKYSYDGAAGALRLGAVLGEGLAFPCDFGFFPSTLGEDGDPLDALLFVDPPLPPASIAAVRLIGVMEVKQRKGQEPWERNDRFLAVATVDRAHRETRTLADLRPRLLDELEAFLKHYTAFEGKELQVVGRGGPGRARRLLEAGARAFRRRR